MITFCKRAHRPTFAESYHPIKHKQKSGIFYINRAHCPTSAESYHPIKYKQNREFFILIGLIAKCFQKLIVPVLYPVFSGIREYPGQFHRSAEACRSGSGWPSGRWQYLKASIRDPAAWLHQRRRHMRRQDGK